MLGGDRMRPPIPIYCGRYELVGCYELLYRALASSSKGKCHLTFSIELISYNYKFFYQSITAPSIII